MIYQCFCKLCEDCQHFDLSESDIEEMIVFKVTEQASFISYICRDCSDKISEIASTHSLQKQINAFTQTMQGNQKGLHAVYEEFRKLSEKLDTINEVYELTIKNNSFIKRMATIAKILDEDE